ncbi:MAG: 2-oxoglutarate dehydrogenase E1 component [Gammaproteobacteria bacterium]|nr:MAG: 2-oxoglutarate dehydrogenase E1 component [Gammaproteobacteria bacterium]
MEYNLKSSNAAYIDGMYEEYLKNPEKLDSHWIGFFKNYDENRQISHRDIRNRFYKQGMFQSNAPVFNNYIHEHKQNKVLSLIRAYRFDGHLFAQIDPLQMSYERDASLSLKDFDLSDDDLNLEFNGGHLTSNQKKPLSWIVNELKKIYCGSIGSEYEYLSNINEKQWLRQKLESNKPTINPEISKKILENLSYAEILEQHLHNKYVGQKRFSLEGGESLIVLLNRITEQATKRNTQQIVIGMAHRGRLNVLINVMGKSVKNLFNEFEGKVQSDLQTGDVKYHQGFTTDVNNKFGKIRLALAHNPSHLEIVAPVVEGQARARQQFLKDKYGDFVFPVVIHGDSAFAGQGVVMETLNMSQTRGFSAKGAIHIILNNQIGFTTSSKQDTRSTYYCSDVAKMINAPIFHVNADDPDAVYFIAKLAIEYRFKFKKDIIIDLFCYRRHGHNEADEPSATQPIMYQAINSHPTTLSIYGNKLIEKNIIDQRELTEHLQKVKQNLKDGKSFIEESSKRERTSNWDKYKNKSWQEKCDTRMDFNVLRSLGKQLDKKPANFTVHPRVAKIYEQRLKMASGALKVDWGFAETLAYASLLYQGYSVRISGQDSGRGTFFHRHSVLHNQNKKQSYVPLMNLKVSDAKFLVIDSILSEEAVLAFEYGYSSFLDKTLTIWEAQFGDFANGAQVVIDQFIVSAEAKWGKLSALTLFLPHGFEGQGSEHSSGRIERFMQLFANDNIQICVPTNASQIFHLLRRQMIRAYRKPLIVFTPKSLLRLPEASCDLNDLSQGKFHNIITNSKNRNHIKKVVLCSGKLFYDLCKKQPDNIAVIAIEQLAPFPMDELKKKIQTFKNADEFIWAQEEPKNQGAWYHIRHCLSDAVAKNIDITYCGREACAAVAAGSAKIHADEQRKLINDALNL